jgi:hypothetical protein
MPDSLRDDLLSLKPPEFVGRWFVEKTPHLFAGDQAAHVAWRRTLADTLGVSLFDLVIVGSAALGKSLNPAHPFALFSDDSDIDVAVVSDHYFDLAWRWMRRLGADRYRLPQTAQNWVKEHESRLVYWGSIATDQLLPHLPFGPDWVPKLAELAAQPPVNGREINVRLYRDHASLEAYLTRSVRKLRAILDSTEDDTTDE